MDLVLHTFYFAGEFINCRDQALIDVALGDLFPGLAKKKLCVALGLPHDTYDFAVTTTSISGMFEFFFAAIGKTVAIAIRRPAAFTIVTSRKQRKAEPGGRDITGISASARPAIMPTRGLA